METNAAVDDATQKVRINFEVDQGDHTALKVLAAKNQTTIADLLRSSVKGQVVQDKDDVRVNINVPGELRAKWKIEAVHQNTDVTSMILAAMHAYLNPVVAVANDDSQIVALQQNLEQEVTKRQPLEQEIQRLKKIIDLSRELNCNAAMAQFLLDK